MGCTTSNDRFNSARKLLDYGFANYTFIRATADEKDLLPIPVKGGTGSTVTPECNTFENFLVEKSKAKTLTIKTELSEMLKAPVTAGQQVGVARVYVDGVEIGTVKITAKESIKKLTFFESFKILLKNLFYV